MQKASSGTPFKLYWYGVGTDPLSESDASGNISEEYIFMGGARIAMLTLSSGAVNYYVADHLGSSRIVTNASGTVLDDSDFYPFGGERPYLSSSGNNYKFTGKERDAESGLDDFDARFYSSSLGRFVSPDSSGYSSLANAQSWNLYAYTLNNPIKYVDPTGHTVELSCADKTKCQQVVAGATGNAAAASRVTSTTVTTNHSFLGIHWTTSHTYVTITGNINSFRALSANARKLADLVQSKQNFTVDIRNTYLTNDRQGWTGENTALFNSAAPFGGGLTQTPSMTGNNDGNVYVKPDPSMEDPEAKAEGIPGANLFETMAHELLGHMWGEVFGNHPAGTAANKQDAVNAENAVRATDPSRGQKQKHD